MMTLAASAPHFNVLQRAPHALHARVRQIVGNSVARRRCEGTVESEKKYLMWNQASAGFTHQFLTLVHGFACALALDRSVVLNWMNLSAYHNRTRDGIPRPRLCSPKLFFDWEKLNQVLDVKIVDELSDVSELLHPSYEYVDALNPNHAYDTKYLFVKRAGVAEAFLGRKRLPRTLVENANLILQALDFSTEIQDRAQAVTKRLGDYDAIHVRRGDALRSVGRYRVFSAEEMRSKTDLNKQLERLKRVIEPGRKVYLATDERDTSIFDSLRSEYVLYFKEDFPDLMSDEHLPLEARANNDYLMCIEVLILSDARRFVAPIHSAVAHQVDWRRQDIPGIDTGIYNFSGAQYLQDTKKREILRRRVYPGPTHTQLKERLKF
jgi:hypothetical protein